MHSPQPLSTSAMTSQSHSTPWRHNSNTKNVAASAREYDQNRFEISGSALEHVSISLSTRANTWMLDSVYIKGNQKNFFSKMWRISLPRILQKKRFTVLTKNGGGDHKRRLSRVHYICTMHCVQCTLEKQCTAHHVIKRNKTSSSKWLDGVTFIREIDVTRRNVHRLFPNVSQNKTPVSIVLMWSVNCLSQFYLS